MLTQLTIQDVVLISKLSVPFAEGLNVLSGETGAGKSILLDALSLALGARSDAGLVKTGADKAQVTASFDGATSPALAALLKEHDLDGEEQLILRRIVGQDGKSRAFVNDHPVTISLLKQIGEALLEVHGQFETHGLLSPATHKSLLDSFGAHGALLKETAATYQLWQDALRRHDKAQAESERARAEEDFLRAAVHELEDAAPEEEEMEKLTQQRTQLMGKEKIMDALNQAEKALSDSKNGAASSLATAGKNLARAAEKAPFLDKILEIVDRAADDVEEACRAISSCAQDIDADPNTLEGIEERFFKLRGLARKHNCDPDALPDLLRDLKERLDLLTDQGGQIAKLAKEVMERKAAYKKVATQLSESRLRAAGKLAKGIMKELPPLKLDRAVFTVQCAALPEEQWGETGMDKIAFLASTNPGTPPSPLHKVASGGELSRFMLAIKVVLADADPVPTLVFDEVDTGIGGATSTAVGERLAALGKNVQVLVVTHSPQVAALGHHHLKVEKTSKGKNVATHVYELSLDERIEEIARMLAGETTTQAARDAALALMGLEKKRKSA